MGDEWHDDDAALWHTLDILAAAATGRIRERQPILTQFAPQYGPGEIVLAQGSFRLAEFVSSHGSYLQTRSAFLPGAWEHVDAASVVDRSCTHLQGRSTRGNVSYLVQSPWAELVFLLWVLALESALRADGG